MREAPNYEFGETGRHQPVRRSAAGNDAIAVPTKLCAKSLKMNWNNADCHNRFSPQVTNIVTL
jgi:hypothetical protein